MTDTPTVAGIPQRIKTGNEAYSTSEDEFAVLLTSGRIFYTGGFESIKSLQNTLTDCIQDGGGTIAGSFEPNDLEYYHYHVGAGSVEGILDLRGPA